jgi:hypothetical protein
MKLRQIVKFCSFIFGWLAMFIQYPSIQIAETCIWLSCQFQIYVLKRKKRNGDFFTSQIKLLSFIFDIKKASNIFAKPIPFLFIFSGSRWAKKCLEFIWNVFLLCHFVFIMVWCGFIIVARHSALVLIVISLKSIWQLELV